MKRIFRNNRIIVVAFFTVFSMVAAPAAVMANDSSTVVPVQLKYIGQMNNQPLFQLSFAGNEKENEFTIIIKDEGGNTLYRENIKGEVFYKKFLVNRDEIGDSFLRFEVISKKTNKSAVFEVNSEARYVEDMVVNKIK